MSKFRNGASIAVIATLAGLLLHTGDPAEALPLLVLGLSGIALVAAVLGLFVLIVRAVPEWRRRARGISHDEHLAELEAQGRAKRETYEVRRAMTLEDGNHPSIVHFLDVGDGRVLFLYGQSYYEFEPITDDPELSQPRRFPTRTFSLLRDLGSGVLLQLDPDSGSHGPGSEGTDDRGAGGIVEPELTCEVLELERLKDLGIRRWRDGELVTDVSYDTLRTAVEGIRRDDAWSSKWSSAGVRGRNLAVGMTVAAFAAVLTSGYLSGPAVLTVGAAAGTSSIVWALLGLWRNKLTPRPADVHPAVRRVTTEVGTVFLRSLFPAIVVFALGQFLAG